MREIKFRMFDSEEKEFMCGHRTDQTRLYELNRQGRWVYSQYTGLKDKNGKEVYEGDIVEFNDFASLRTGGHIDDNIIIGQVCLSCGAWIVKNDIGHYDFYEALVNDEELEVIGNIYENPELLEGE